MPDAARLHKDLRKAFSDGDSVTALRILGQARGLLSDVHGRKLRSVLESTMISQTVGKLRRCEKMAAEVRARAGELNAAWKASIKRGTIGRPVAVRRPVYKAAVYTFSGCVENHVGMEQLGEKRAPLTLADLQTMAQSFPASRLVSLGAGSEDAPTAHVLHIPRGVARWADPNRLFEELRDVGAGGGVDTKAVFRGKVLNKHARWNFNVTDDAQPPDYAAGKGTVHSFTDLGELSKVRAGLGRLGIERLGGLYAEANVYYADGCGIGYHGDSERHIAVGANMGQPRTILWQLYHRFAQVGAPVAVTLQHGDMYAMCGKAIGTDWKRSSVYTYRHRAGDAKWLAKSDKGVARKAR